MADKASSGAYRKYVLYILLVVYTFNFIDRQIVAILSPAIKADLGLNDTQLGFLKGFAFAIFYSVLGIPIARLADRYSRVNIISISLALWSAMTAVCGLAANFWQLALARVGVGVGEAGCTPPAHSIISDYFPKEERASAIAVYSSGIYLGLGFAFLAGGWLVTELGWRLAFVVVGLPGVLLAVIVRLTVKEPIRGAQESVDTGGEMPPLVDGVKSLLAIPTYRAICIAVSLTSLAGYGFSTWVVDFLIRTRGVSYLEISVPLAIVFGVGGALGALVGGKITEAKAKNDPSAYLRTPGIWLLWMTPFFVAAIWVDIPLLYYSAMFVTVAISASYLGPAFSLIQTLAPVRLRALSTAVFFLIINFIGLGGGPQLVGIASDMLGPVFGGDDALALQWALMSLLLAYIVAGIVFMRAAGRVKKDWDTAEASVSGASASFAAETAEQTPPKS